MNVETEPRVPYTDVSLVRGGPCYRAQLAVGLIHENKWNIGRRITFVIAIGWVPLLLITALTDWGALPSLLTDYRVYSRALIGIPVLLLGELLMDLRFCEVVRHVRRAALMGSLDLEYMEGVVAAMARLRDSFIPELLILGVVMARTVLMYRAELTDTTRWLGHGTGSEFHLSAAGWYATIVGASLFEFLLCLGLWKWLHWTYFAFKVSRRNLKLVPTHPDGHGGLGFVGDASSAFAAIAFAATAVIGSTWRHEIINHRAHVMDFKLPAIALAVIVALIAFAPLVFFVPRLAILRRRGIREYGLLGHISSTEFHEKWIVQGAGRGGQLLQATDSIALNNFRQDYSKIEELSPFAVEMADLHTLAAAIVIPLLPAVVAEIPLGVVLKDLLSALR